MEKTIRVTGKGTLSLKPDTIRINITLEGTEKKYDDSLQRSSRDTKSLRSLLAGFGFPEDSLKTADFRIDADNEGYRDANGDWKHRFLGYRFSHHMKLEFPADNKILGKLLYALAKSPLHPDFSLDYTVKDPEAAKLDLLAAAVQDSRRKAEALTAAAGATLMDLVTIDYSWGTLDFSVRPMEMRCLSLADGVCDNESYDLDVEAEDIRVSDTVTIVWQIG